MKFKIRKLLVVLSLFFVVFASIAVAMITTNGKNILNFIASGSFQQDKVDEKKSSDATNSKVNTEVAVQDINYDETILENDHRSFRLGNYTEIPEQKFKGMSDIEVIYFPKSVVKIGKESFKNCSNLRVISIPKTIQVIQASAFENCIELSEIYTTAENVMIDPTAFKNISNNVTVFYGSEKAKNSLVQNKVQNDSPIISPKKSIHLRNNHFKISSDNVNGLSENGKKQAHLEIPSGISALMPKSFENSLNLISVTIPKTVTTISESSFQNCVQLTTITIPNSVRKIGNNCFLGCNNLTSVYINSKRVQIENNAFSGIHHSIIFYLTSTILKQILIDKHNILGSQIIVCDEGNFIFDKTTLVGLTSLGKQLSGVNVPDGITTIAKYAFYNNINLYSVTLPKSISIVETDAFVNCPNLESIICYGEQTDFRSNFFEKINQRYFFYLPKKNNTFYNLISVLGTQKHVVILQRTSSTLKTDQKNVLSQIRNIEPYEYARNNEMENFIVSEGVEVIGMGAFKGCKNLSKIVLSESVREIGESAFENCYSLKTVVLSANAKIAKIDKRTFFNCVNLETIQIPSFVRHIKMEAFANCTNLSEIIFETENKLCCIDNKAFENCKSLKKTTIPQTVVNFGHKVFLNAGGEFHVTSGSIAEKLFRDSKIDANFIHCPDMKLFFIMDDKRAVGLTKLAKRRTFLHVDAPIKVIGHKLFSEVHSLRKITFGTSVTKLEKNVFYRSRYLKEVLFDPKCQIESIPVSTFEECMSLEKVELPDSIQIFEDRCFFACRELENLKFPRELKNIGKDAFNNCDILEDIQVETTNKINSISDGAFSCCRKLRKINFLNNLEKIEKDAFSYCDNLQEVILSNTVKNIDKDAFPDSENNPETYFYVSSTRISNLLQKNNISSKQICNAENFSYSRDEKNNYLYIDKVIDSNQRMNKVFILPKEVEGIRKKAFANFFFEKIIINDNLKIIEDEVFENCFKFKELIFPSSVNEVGNNVLSKCRSLTKITIESKDITFGNKAFFDVSPNCEITINSKKITLGRQPFQNSKSMLFYVIRPQVQEHLIEHNVVPTSIILADDAYFIYDNRSITGLTKLGTSQNELKIPNGIMTVIESAFCGNNNLKKLVVSDSVTKLGNFAFCWCANLKEVIIPKSITSFGRQIFVGSNRVTDVTNFSKFLFYEWSLTHKYENGKTLTHMTNIDLNQFGNSNGELFEYIAPDALRSSLWLKSIIFPKNIKYIHLSAFDNCNSLKHWIFTDVDASKISFDGNLDLMWNTNLFVWTNSQQLATKLEKENHFLNEEIIYTPNINDFEIDGNAIAGLTKIGKLKETINIPNGVQIIKSKAFQDNSNLREIILSDSLTKLENNAFANCSNLTSIVLPHNLNSIGRWAFKNCHKLSEIIIQSPRLLVKYKAFEKINENAKFSVVNQDVRDALIWSLSKLQTSQIEIKN